MIKIDLISIIFAVFSIAVAKASTELAVPFLVDVFDVTIKQKEWIFLLNIWAVGYWGYPLKEWLSSLIRKNKVDDTPTLQQ
ncbi:MAG: hypothetical protein ACTH2P_05495 [Oceanisphaera sp.]